VHSDFANALYKIYLLIGSVDESYEIFGKAGVCVCVFICTQHQAMSRNYPKAFSPFRGAKNVIFLILSSVFDVLISALVLQLDVRSSLLFLLPAMRTRPSNFFS
jgi:hypothetical protein